MKVLFVSPEVSPLSKTGGLGDVVGALPQALRNIGVDARILCPLYRDLDLRFDGKSTLIGPLRVTLGRKPRRYTVRKTMLPGTEVPVYLLEHKSSFDRAGIYSGSKGDYPDNDERFLLLSKSALALPEAADWIPDVFHVHDWTVALIPALIKALEPTHPLRKCASVLTIHNLMHQGVFPAETFSKTGLPSSWYNSDGLEQNGYLNMLKGGIHHANKITTVSPTYAREIQEEPLSLGLESSLRQRAADLIGILNGIDCGKWNPETDTALPRNYSIEDVGEGKLACKAALLEQVGLPPNLERPLFFVVSRLDHQKGLDLLANVLNRLIQKEDLSFILLGNGDPKLENAYSELARQRPDCFAAVIGFDGTLARRLFGGGDFLVMPSRFEPCGLTQLYAMRYGAIPIVRKTGGLADTITPWCSGSTDSTGISFEEKGEWGLFLAMEQALRVFPSTMDALRRSGMSRDSSWGASAEAYAQTYSWAMEAQNETARKPRKKD